MIFFQGYFQCCKFSGKPKLRESKMRKQNVIRQILKYVYSGVLYFSLIFHTFLNFLWFFFQFQGRTRTRSAFLSTATSTSATASYQSNLKTRSGVLYVYSRSRRTFQPKWCMLNHAGMYFKIEKNSQRIRKFFNDKIKVKSSWTYYNEISS